MHFTKREVFSIFLLLIIGLLALGAWQAFFGAMANPGISDIWQPMLWFALLAACFFLGAVVWTNRSFSIAGAALVFLPGLLFLYSWEYAVAGAASAGLIFLSSLHIARESEERLRFHFFKNVRAGQFLFVLGFSLLLSGGYFVFLQDASWEELVPRFRIGEEMTVVIFKAASVVNPSFASLSEGDVTVDEFLLSLEKRKGQDASEQALPQAAPGMNALDLGLLFDARQEQVAQALFLQAGREQIATLTGRPVAGEEKISDVLSLALQTKLIALLSGGKAAQHIPSQAIPFFLSLLLFLTLLTFVSLVAPLCILVAHGIFRLALWLGWLRLDTASVQQEKLAA
ncbi:MAG: hypothetical protein A2878_02835 [Candidatus Moranbacteria bacterium RIFCSPHIGHO2_01_FULL_54_31]|nr:MAG: hypothetical protein A2878_02835 [Candidatus Moranbacteria bacterium RIFCSPHIGHO2_01_FULL_54_31]